MQGPHDPGGVVHAEPQQNAVVLQPLQAGPPLVLVVLLLVDVLLELPLVEVALVLDALVDVLEAPLVEVALVLVVPLVDVVLVVALVDVALVPEVLVDVALVLEALVEVVLVPRGVHVPATQASPAQQPLAQLWPCVAQAVQTSFAQVPLQHSENAAHGWPPDLHAEALVDAVPPPLPPCPPEAFLVLPPPHAFAAPTASAKAPPQMIFARTLPVAAARFT